MEEVIRFIQTYSDERFGRFSNISDIFGRAVCVEICESIMDNPFSNPFEIIEGIIIVTSAYKQSRKNEAKGATLFCDMMNEIAYDIWTLLKGDIK